MAPNAIAAVAAPFGRDLDAAFARVERIVRSARAKGVGLIVFPECTLGGYLRDPESHGGLLELAPALDPDGPEIERLIRIAGDTVICVGYSEAGERGPYSASVCVSGDGVLGRHRKVHLPPAERFAYQAGEGFAAFDTPVGRMGMLLCYDKLFPESARVLAEDGAVIIACMAAWPVDRHAPARRVQRDRQTAHFDVIDRSRAIENQVVWVSANLTGDWGRRRFLGHSKVVDPDGWVLASTGHREGVAIARVDARAKLTASRQRIDHLGDRRPDAYATPHAPARLSTNGWIGPAPDISSCAPTVASVHPE